ncbi:MAG: YhgE/Pip family protein [Cryobacterium sp.]
MKVFAMIRAELARLTATTMSRIALVALMFVPVLYGGLYLWANHDPYSGLDRVPVALVVADAGAHIDGEPRNYGNEVADQLIDDGAFDWDRVSASTARAGVTDGSYDFSVTLPADFSDAISSPSGDSPRQAGVTLTTNDTNSYLASTIGSQAAKALREAIVKKVNEQAAGRFLFGLSDIRSSLISAADGARKATDGAVSAHAGGVKIATGAATLADGTRQLADGTTTVATGAKGVSAGAANLAAGSRRVSDGTRQVSAGAANLAEGSSQLSSSASSGAAGSAAATTAALGKATVDLRSTLAADGLDEAQIDDALGALAPVGTALQRNSAGVQEILGGIDRLSSSSAALAAGASEAATGAESAAGGAAQLADGAGKVAAGASSAATGAAEASTGAGALSGGAADLRDGLGTLAHGTEELRDGLQTGVDGIPGTNPATRDRQAKTIANPVDLRNTAITSAGTYGAGLAPFFASLAAWIGIYALFLIVKPVSRRAITAMHTPLRITLAGWLTPGLLGAAQMGALFFVLTAALKFEVHNPLGTYSMMALAALAFAAIILALNVWLGSVGQFLGLVLMVVQLVTAGGTFPWQTLPAPLAWLHHVVPMSYAVDGIRQLMYGGNEATAWADAGVLLLWLAGGLVLAAIGVTRMTHFRTLRDLRPSLIG